MDISEAVTMVEASMEASAFVEATPRTVSAYKNPRFGALRAAYTASAALLPDPMLTATCRLCKTKSWWASFRPVN